MLPTRTEWRGLREPQKSQDLEHTPQIHIENAKIGTMIPKFT